MAYYIDTKDGYVCGFGSGTGERNLNADEFNGLLSKIKSKPTAPDGYDYRLREDTLEWELTEVPPAPDPAEEEITAEEALGIITGGKYNE